MSASDIGSKLETSTDRFDEIRRIARTYSKMAANSAYLGNAPSPFHGQGRDFGELRKYEYGEDARNIDWKASVRAQTLLSRVYFEEREKRILIICPVGSSISGNTSMGEPKSDVLAQTMGSIAYISRGYGDRFAFLFDSPEGLYRSEFHNGLEFLERNLALFERSCKAPGTPTGLYDMAYRVMTEMGNRLVVFLLGDEEDFADGGVEAAKDMAQAGYDVRALAVDDAYLFENDSYDMDACGYLPFIPDKELGKLRLAEQAERFSLRKQLYWQMDGNGVLFETVSMEKSIPDALLAVLAGRHRR